MRVLELRWWSYQIIECRKSSLYIIADGLLGKLIHQGKNWVNEYFNFHVFSYMLFYIHYVFVSRQSEIRNALAIPNCSLFMSYHNTSSVSSLLRHDDHFLLCKQLIQEDVARVVENDIWRNISALKGDISENNFFVAKQIKSKRLSSQIWCKCHQLNWFDISMLHDKGISFCRLIIFPLWKLVVQLLMSNTTITTLWKCYKCSV